MGVMEKKKKKRQTDIYSEDIRKRCEHMKVNVSLETSEREELYSNGTRAAMASRSTVSPQQFVLAYSFRVRLHLYVEAARHNQGHCQRMRPLGPYVK